MNALTLRSFTILLLGAVPAAASARGGHDHSYASHHSATVLVDNETSVAVTVTVDRGQTRVLAPYESARFVASGKYAEISSSYVQFGERRQLASGLIPIRSGRTAYFDIEPVTVGLLKVVNDTGISAEVYLDGRELIDLDVGQTRLVRVPLGPARIEMRARGQSVARLDTTIRAFAEPTLVGRAPSFASVTVINPFPFDIRVSDDRGNTRTIDERGRAVFGNVPVGNTQLVARRLSGEVIDQEHVSVRAWSGAVWTVDPPSTGVLLVDSNVGRTTRVLVDGRVTAILPAYAEQSLRLPIGFASIEVRDLDGNLLERARVEVNAWRTIEVDVGYEGRRPSSATAYSYDDDQDRHDSEGRRPDHAESDSMHDHDHRDGEGASCSAHGRNGG
jgi:hypothetical protein